MIKKHKHSLSLSPIRNTLAKQKEKYKNNFYAKNSDSRFDSTQESLNIEAYMQNNSTLAIEEVDEDDYKEHMPCNIQKPRELPALNHSPRLPDSKNIKKPVQCRKKQKSDRQNKLDNWIFIVDNNDSFENQKSKRNRM